MDNDWNKQLKMVVTTLVEAAAVLHSLSHAIEAMRRVRPKDDVTEILHREGLYSPSYDEPKNELLKELKDRVGGTSY